MVGLKTEMRNLRTEARELAGQVVAWRRHLHEHPELSFEEHETSRWVLGQLRALPDVELFQPTQTSVVARIVRGDGPVVALRSELDALPIHEHDGVPVRSRVDGVMHACGHDAHTAILLGVAHVLARAPAPFAGELRLLFQHAEEKPPGGARELAAAGVLEGVRQSSAVISSPLSRPDRSRSRPARSWPGTTSSSSPCGAVAAMRRCRTRRSIRFRSPPRS